MVHGPSFGPSLVAGLSSVRDLRSSGSFSCAAEAQRVACWGPFVGLFLGASPPDEHTPATVAGLEGCVAVAVVDQFVCGLGAVTQKRERWTAKSAARAARVSSHGHGGSGRSTQQIVMTRLLAMACRPTKSLCRRAPLKGQ